jgi:hypothetical protein
MNLGQNYYLLSFAPSVLTLRLGVKCFFSPRRKVKTEGAKRRVADLDFEISRKWKRQTRNV